MVSLNKKAQEIFAGMIVLVLLIALGFALFQFITKIEKVNILTSSFELGSLYQAKSKLIYFANESAKLAITQAYYEFARDGKFACENRPPLR